MKPLRYFVALTLVAGMCLTGRALYLHAKAEVAGVLIRRAWQAASRGGQSRPPWPWADTHPVARLCIPRLNYDEIVLEGATPRTLAGDKIEVEWYDVRAGRLRQRTYTVNTMRVVAPEDISLLAPTSDDVLTLITCYPFGLSPRSPQRYIVRASPVGSGVFNAALSR